MTTELEKKRLILWVDDDQELLRQQRAYIQEEGYDVHIAADVDEAIAMIRNKVEDIAGIIIDIMMSPGTTLRRHNHRGGLMTGLVLLEYLKSENLVTYAAPSTTAVFHLHPPSGRNLSSEGAGPRV